MSLTYDAAISIPTLNSFILLPVGSNCWNLSAGTSILDYECAHIEADTMMCFIYSQMRRAGIQTAVIIDAEDTDVVV